MPYVGVKPADITSATEAEIAGDLTVDTSTLIVDSANNKVGIGTTSPTYQATVFGSSQSTVEIESGSDTGESRLYFTDPSTTGVGEIGYYHNGNTMRFQVNSAERMRINSDGQITSPNQPRFSINGGANSYKDGSNTETTVLHGQSGVFSEDVNNGSHFSYTNGRFTAPVAGQYMFTYTLTTNDANSHFIELRKNGNSITTILLYGLQYNSGCHSTILTLAANDYVDARRRGSSGYSVYSAVFSGYLMG